MDHQFALDDAARFVALHRGQPPAWHSAAAARRREVDGCCILADGRSSGASRATRPRNKSPRSSIHLVLTLCYHRVGSPERRNGVAAWVPREAVGGVAQAWDPARRARRIGPESRWAGMTKPNVDTFLDLVRRSGLVEKDQLDAALSELTRQIRPARAGRRRSGRQSPGRGRPDYPLAGRPAAGRPLSRLLPGEVQAAGRSWAAAA